MKRYIVALMALLSLTACKIDDGFGRSEDAVDRLLYNRALTAIQEASGYPLLRFTQTYCLAEMRPKFALQMRCFQITILLPLSKME